MKGERLRRKSRAKDWLAMDVPTDKGFELDALNKILRSCHHGIVMKGRNRDQIQKATIEEYIVTAGVGAIGGMSLHRFNKAS